MVKNVLLNILYAGQQDREKSDVRRQLIISSMISLISFCFLVFFGIRDLNQGDTFLGSVVLCGAVVSGASHVYLRWSGDYQATSWHTVITSTVLSFFLLITGGQQGTGPLWLYGLPSFIFFSLELKRGRIILGGFLVLTFCVLFVPHFPLVQIEYPLYFSLRFFLSFTAVSFIAYMYEYMRVDGKKELIALSEELDLLARRDALTGLSNRRDMLEKLQYEEDRFARSSQSFSVLLIDIDNFKKVNDTYGHSAGDHILCELSTLLRKTVQKRDTVARWGGEEFLVLLPETSLEDALKIAERLRQQVEKSRYIFKRKIHQVTISIGVSQYQQGIHVEKVLLSQADKMLYVAKNNGRNRVVI